MDDQRFELISAKIKELYSIIYELEKSFPGRHFTLDGHLVGSIGEVLAAHIYDLDLLTASTEKHDAISRNGNKMVQIKATQVKSIGLSSEPDYLIVLQIQADGDTIEVYNGPGNPVWEQTGPLQKNGQKYISVSKLRKLNELIPITSRIMKVH